MIVTTTKGKMDDSLLVKKEGGFEDDNENTVWIEYYLDNELVHRSAHVKLKRPMVLLTEVGGLNG
jgi:hypothetical protein